MSPYEELLQDLEAKAEKARREARDAQVKAETLEYAAVMLRNAMRRAEVETRVKGPEVGE